MAIDPNQYSKNSNIKPNSIWHSLQSIVIFLLAILGLVGLTLELFKQDGQLVNFFSQWYDSAIFFWSLIPLAIILWLFNHWTVSPDARKKPWIGNLPLFIMVLLGVYYAYRFITTGAL